MTCDGKDGVREYINEATRLRETLAGMGHLLAQAKFNVIVTTALPASYSTLILSVSIATAAVGRTIGSSELLALIQEQYDSKPHKSAPTNNVALYSKQGNM